jgi:hypothetical protein
MHSVHIAQENNAQTHGYVCITYLHVCMCVCVCVCVYMLQVQNRLTDFELITHQRYATGGQCKIGIFYSYINNVAGTQTCNLDTLLRPPNLTGKISFMY